MIFDEYKIMHNGVKIPVLGLGTWKASEKEAADVLRNGVEIGYRHFDTARAYGNEKGVGEGIKTCGISRDKLFITSKIPAEMKTYKEAVDSIKQSVEKLGTDYIDLMLIHWPRPWDETAKYNNYFKENIEVWTAMVEAYENGILRSIGVSNFNADDILNLANNCRLAPMVNQILANVSNTPSEMIAFCNENNIVTEAYSPNGNGSIIELEKLRPIAEKYGVSIPQICIKYTIQLGMVSLPKTTNIAHMKSDCELDFTISDEDMKLLMA